FLGTLQAGCVLALDLFGVPKDLAVGFSLLTWLVQMLVNVVLGGFFVAREDLSLRQLVSGTAAAPAEGRPGACTVALSSSGSPAESPATRRARWCGLSPRLARTSR